MKTINEMELTTDVLVIGAGAGGLMAAIGAADSGADVILCEIGNARRSGGIVAGNDHFWCYLPEIHGPAMKEKMINHHMSIFGGQKTEVRQKVIVPRRIRSLGEVDRLVRGLGDEALESIHELPVIAQAKGIDHLPVRSRQELVEPLPPPCDTLLSEDDVSIVEEDIRNRKPRLRAVPGPFQGGEDRDNELART